MALVTRLHGELNATPGWRRADPGAVMWQVYYAPREVREVVTGAH